MRYRTCEINVQDYPTSCNHPRERGDHILFDDVNASASYLPITLPFT